MPLQLVGASRGITKVVVAARRGSARGPGTDRGEQGIGDREALGV
jgi:hypothetical protein